MVDGPWPDVVYVDHTQTRNSGGSYRKNVNIDREK